MSATLQELNNVADAVSAEQDCRRPKAYQKLGFLMANDLLTDENRPRYGRKASPADAASLPWAEFPDSEIAFLHVPPGEKPRLESQRPQCASEVIAIEPMYDVARPMAVLRRPSREVRVNGLPAPRVTVLREGDRVSFGDSEWVLTLSLYRRPFLGPRPDELAEAVCACCRQPFLEEQMVFLCAACGTAYHMQGEEVPAAERLECARLLEHCSHCGAPMTMTEGFSYVPD